MRNNVMSEVAGLLGLLIDEEFMVDEKIYMIDEDGLWIKENNQRRTSNDLENLLTGRKEFVKLPWKPKKGEYYYTFVLMVVLMGDKWVVRSSRWGGLPNEYALLDKGWVYRSQAEAEAALPKVAKEMGVEYKI